MQDLKKLTEIELNLLRKKYFLLFNLVKVLFSKLETLKAEQKKHKNSIQLELKDFEELFLQIEPLNEKIYYLIEEKKSLECKSSELKKELDYYKNLTKGLEQKLNHFKFTLLGKEQKKALLVQENKLPQIRQNLSVIRSQVLELQQVFNQTLNQNFETLKNSIDSNQEKTEMLELHIFQLEESKKSLENSNSQLEKNLGQSLEFKRTVSTKNKQKTKNLRLKVQKILRKLKAIRNVLTREKEIIKHFHTNLYDWIVNNITHSMQEEFEFRYNSLIDTVKEEFQIKETQHLKEIANLNNRRVGPQVKIFIKKIRQELAQSRILVKNMPSQIFSEFSDVLKLNIGKLMKSSQNKIEENNETMKKFKEKVKNKCQTIALTLNDYKTKNHELHSIFDQFMRLSLKDKETNSSKILSL